MLPFIMTTVGSTLASALATIITSISTFISTYAPTIARALDTVNHTLRIIATTIQVLQPNENMEDMGNRALQAAAQGIQPEQFNHYHDYLNHLRQLPLNPQLVESYSHTDQQLTGLAIVCHSIEQKLNLPPNSMGILATMVALNPHYFHAERINHWLNTGADLSQIIKYFNHDLGSAASLHTEHMLIQLEKPYRSLSDAELEAELEQVKADLQHSAPA